MQGRASSIIGGGGADIHIFVFTHHKNNWFEKKLIVQNPNIWISAPPIIELATALNMPIFLTFKDWFFVLLALMLVTTESSLPLVFTRPVPFSINIPLSVCTSPHFERLSRSTFFFGVVVLFWLHCFMQFAILLSKTKVECIRIRSRARTGWADGINHPNSILRETKEVWNLSDAFEVWRCKLFLAHVRLTNMLTNIITSKSLADQI